MGGVRTPSGPAWIAQGLVSPLVSTRCTGPVLGIRTQEGFMQDVLYVALTIVVFGVLWLIVKGIENFER